MENKLNFTVAKRLAGNKVWIIEENFTKKLVEDNPKCLFVFTEALNIKNHKQGEYSIRDCINVLPMIMASGQDEKADMDWEFHSEDNKERLHEAYINILNKTSEYKYIVLPYHGIGTKNYSFRKNFELFSSMSNTLFEMFGFNNYYLMNS